MEGSFYTNVIEKTLNVTWSWKTVDNFEGYYDKYDQTVRDLFFVLLSHWVKKNLEGNNFLMSLLEYSQKRLTNERQRFHKEIVKILLDEIGEKIESGDSTTHLFPQE